MVSLPTPLGPEITKTRPHPVGSRPSAGSRHRSKSVPGAGSLAILPTMFRDRADGVRRHWPVPDRRPRARAALDEAVLSFDALTLHAVVDELRARFAGARIQRVA